MYDCYYSSCNWEQVELLHQCKGNVNSCLALCVVVFLLFSCVFFVDFYMLINHFPPQKKFKKKQNYEI